MAFTNIKENGLESLIVDFLVNEHKYEQGLSKEYKKDVKKEELGDYNFDYAIDEKRLFRFLVDTQPLQMKETGALDSDTKKYQFLARVRDEIAKRGIVDVLRKGIKFYPVDLIMFYLLPSQNNVESQILYKKNIFSVIRQLHFSKVDTKDALDMCIFINGLPIATFELKNQLTKQNVDDAVDQYKNDRNKAELIFQFKRCMAHFSVDDNQVKFCTKLDGDRSVFLPFNKGYNDGAGNPPNPDGIKTDYLWKDILDKYTLTKIIQNYAQVVVEKNNRTKKETIKQIFPRYHQFDVVEKLLDDVYKNGIGKKYLIQHSAGSGKSNSIAWLSHQLIKLEKDGHPMIDSVIVVTDRRVLDKNIRDSIKEFTQVKSTVVWAEHSSDLLKAIENNKKIIITTIEKFPFVMPKIGSLHKNNKFAIIIDEAHSGQSGRNSAQMNMVLSGMINNLDMDDEDKINAMVEGRKLLQNASYFAFTATPKNKTLEMFGEPYEVDGVVKHRPFHLYSMRQAIEEKFILDVLKYYTPIESYYKLIKTIDDDPTYDKIKAKKKLKKYVESNAYTINEKAKLMVQHFHEQVIAKKKINGKARCMVVTSSIPNCVEYYYAINKCLEEMHSPYKSIIAYSGEYKRENEETALTCSARNGFSDKEIEEIFENDPYRFLIVADMFQTGYDEPLLHTMYVDKVLTDIKAVQTLSRLNRAEVGKIDTFVLDFVNDVETIKEAFSKYYKTTILSEETDPNKLYDLIADIENANVYTNDDIDKLVGLYINGAERDKLDLILDVCAECYKELEEEEKIKFKGSAKGFLRTYSFLGAILPYGNVEWEKLSIFLNLLLPKLPSPQDDNDISSLLSAVDLNSYRIEAKNMINISLEDKDAEIGAVPTGKVGGMVEHEVDKLSAILSNFNDLFGNIDWQDEDNVKKQIRNIPEMVSKDTKYQNAMKNSDEQNAKMECEKALNNIILSIMKDNMELYKQFQDNPSFKKWLLNMVFNVTYNKEGNPYKSISND